MGKLSCLAEVLGGFRSEEGFVTVNNGVPMVFGLGETLALAAKLLA